MRQGDLEEVESKAHWCPENDFAEDVSESSVLHLGFGEKKAEVAELGWMEELGWTSVVSVKVAHPFRCCAVYTCRL